MLLVEHVLEVTVAAQGPGNQRPTRSRADASTSHTAAELDAFNLRVRLDVLAAGPVEADHGGPQGFNGHL